MTVSFIAQPSIQEFVLPAPIARPGDEYFDWLDQQVPAVRVVRAGRHIGMHLFGMDRPAIALKAAADVEDAYDVCGGLLVRTPAGGRFTFETLPASRLRISLEGFTPRLPRLIFILTHGLVHEFVMESFRRHLEVSRLEAL